MLDLQLLHWLIALVLLTCVYQETGNLCSVCSGRSTPLLCLTDLGMYGSTEGKVSLSAGLSKQPGRICVNVSVCRGGMRKGTAVSSTSACWAHTHWQCSVPPVQSTPSCFSLCWQINLTLQTLRM